MKTNKLSDCGKSFSESDRFTRVTISVLIDHDGAGLSPKQIRLLCRKLAACGRGHSTLRVVSACTHINSDYIYAENIGQNAYK